MLSVEELRAHRPAEPGFARVLLIVAVVLWAPIAGTIYGTGSGPMGGAMVLAVFGAFGAVKGRQAGRIMATVAIGLLYLWLGPYCWLGFDDPYPYSSVYALLDIAAVLLSVVALTQLYHPNTNRYIHLVTVARRKP